MQQPTSALPSIPAVDTERLTLRGHTAGDFDESAALWADPEVVRHIGGRPQSREEAWTRLLRALGHWSVLGFGYWVVREKATSRFVGEVGFAEFRRELEPRMEGTPEAGWVLARWAHGQGFATEAMTGALGWARLRFGPAQRTHCIIAPGNLASVRVAEKVGYASAGEATYRGEPILLFTR